MPSTAARLRVKIFGEENMSYSQWKVRFSGGSEQTYYQANAQWLYIDVPEVATSIDIEGFAVSEGSMPGSGPETESQSIAPPVTTTTGTLNLNPSLAATTLPSLPGPTTSVPASTGTPLSEDIQTLPDFDVDQFGCP